jgi:PAS domain S-box-containing protein
MKTSKLLQTIRSGWSPIVVIAVTTLAITAISIYCLASDYFIIFQNLFYIPIIIACVYYTKRGFAFSVIIACLYFLLTIAFTHESSILLQAFVRVLIFVLVAGVITYLALARKRGEKSLRRQHDDLEGLVRERTAQLEEDIANRKKREEALSSSEAFLNGVIEQSPESLWVSDSDGTMVRMNLACRELFGVTDEEAVGKYNLFKDNLIEEQGFMPLVEAVFKKGGIARFTIDYDLPRVEHIKVSGAKHRIIDVVISPIKDLSGKVTNAIIQHKDVTERKQAEEALRESKEKYSKAFHVSPNAIMITRAKDGKIMEVNDTFSSISGFTQEEAMLNSSISLSLWANIEDRKWVLSALKDGVEVKNKEFQFKIKNGNLITGLFSSRVIHMAGEPYILSSILDVTDRVRAEEEIKSAKIFFDMIIDMSPFAMWISDKEGTATRVNRSLCKTINLADDEIIGKYNVLKDENLEAQGVMPMVRAVFEKHEPARFSIPWKAANAGEVDFKGARDMQIEVSMFPILNAQGELTNVVCQWIDVTERKQAEDKLRETNEYLENLLNYANAPIIVWNTEFKITRFNHAFESLTGRKSTDVIGKSLEILFPPKMVQSSMDLIKKTLTGERWETVEISILHLDGSIRTVIWNSATIMAPDGKTPVAAIAQGQDITERKRAEEELVATQQLYRELFENVNVAIVRSTPGSEGTFVDVNPAMIRMFEADNREQVLAMHPSQIYWDESQRKIVSDAIVARGLANEEIKFKTLKGNPLWCHINSVKRTDASGQVYFDSTMEDFTDRKQAETALRESEEGYRTTLMSVGDGVITTDAEGWVRLLNPVAETLTGWSQEDARGRPLKEVFRIVNEETRKEVEDPVSRVVREGMVVGLANHTLLIARDGTEHPIADSGAPIRDTGGALTGVVLVFRDQTTERAADRALRESSAKFRDTVKYLDEGYYSCTMEGLVLDHNLAFNRILGIDLNRDMKGAKLPDFWQDPEDRKVYLKEFMATGSINTYPINAKKSNGGKIVVMASSHLAKDEKGNPVRIEGTFLDITDRKRAEEELQESKEKYRSLFENAEIGMYRSKIDGSGLIAANKGLAEIFECTIEELINKPAIMRWADPKKRDDMLRRIKEKGEIKDFEIDIFTKNGEVRTCLTSIKLFPKEGYLEGSTIDITVRKRAEEALRLKNIVFDASIAANSIADMNGTITEANDAFLRVWGYPGKDEVIGKPLPQFINDQKEAIAIVTALNNTGQWEGDYTAKRKDGSTFIAHGQATTVKDEKGTVIGYQSAVMDVTGQREAEEEIKKLNESLERRVRERTNELQISNKELEAFAYSVSHDLRAPLRIIDGFSHALLEDYDDKLDVQGKDYLRRVRASTQMMALLIDDMLKLSRITRTEMNIEKVNLTRIARSVIDELQKSQPERLINIKIADGLEDTADARLMRVALENLLGNAWKFTGKQAEAVIEFGSTQEGGRKVYFIRDNGAGFDMAYVDKLFAPFQRLHTMEEYPGTGIGLATVRRIINRHGGRSWAEGQVGKGATFYFSLQG